MSLQHHRPDNHTEWWEHYKAEMGLEDLTTYVNSVFVGLSNLKLGGHLSIIGKMNPDRYDLFVKSACLFMDMDTEHEYFFSNDYNHIHRHERTTFPPKKKRTLDTGAEGSADTELRNDANVGIIETAQQVGNSHSPLQAS